MKFNIGDTIKIGQIVSGPKKGFVIDDFDPCEGDGVVDINVFIAYKIEGNIYVNNALNSFLKSTRLVLFEKINIIFKKNN